VLTIMKLMKPRHFQPGASTATLLGLKPTTCESRIKQLGLQCPRGSSPIIRGVGGLSDISGVSRLDIR
jgi:hypothetical protein